MAVVIDDEPNPFRLPPDDQIFVIREKERQRRAEERELVKHQKVWQKTTASSRVHRNRRVDDGIDEAQIAAEAASKAKTQRREGSVTRDTRREKENVSEFVKKKREMFLVQMHLDVQKAEILKLDERAKKKDEALKRSQQMLEEDVTRFDAFLQTTDKNAHKALKNAEEKTKIKTEKIQKIRLLRSQLSAITSEIAKLSEQKDECIKFKGFLEKLTPQEWKDEKDNEKVERQLSRKRQWVQEQVSRHKENERAEIEAEERAMEEKAQENSRGRRRPKREAEEAEKERERELEAMRRRTRKKYPSQEQVENDYQGVDSGTERELYFKQPKQLLDVFTSLEGSNLFLIQNSQDTEQVLEEVQQKIEDMQLKYETTTKRMMQNISHLEHQIESETRRRKELKIQLSEKNNSSEQDKLLKDLHQKVVVVHAACGNEKEDTDSHKMLKSIEAKLEELLSYLEEVESTELGKKQVEELEKQYNKRRRDKQREMKKEKEEKKKESKREESWRRSQAPSHKKVGKQIMFRSPPLYQEKREVEEDDGFEDNCKDHHVFGIWRDTEGMPHAEKPVKQT